MSDYGSAIVLQPLMQRLRRSAPAVELVITQHSGEGMIAAVIEGEADVALGVFDSPPPQIENRLLFEDEYACLLDPAFQPQPYAALTRERYWAAPHVLVAVHGQTPTELDICIRGHRKARHIALILPHWSMAPKIIEGTDLILTVARRCLTEDAALEITRPPISLPTIPFSAIHHARRRSDPALRWLIEEIRAATAHHPSLMPAA